MTMAIRWKHVRLVGVLIAAMGLLQLGCGIFGGGGPEERTLELTFRGSDRLNHDGTNAKSVEVAAFVLKRTETFLGGRVATFFDPSYAGDYYAKFAEDTLKTLTFTLKPGGTETKVVRYMPDPTGPKEVYLGVIADFFRRPDVGDRRTKLLKNKSVDRLTITVGENTISSIDR
jgi:type VI secretion system VasD/TssJ family lipoprotein